MPEKPGITWPSNGPVRPLAGVANAPDGGPGAKKSGDKVARPSRTGCFARPPSGIAMPFDATDGEAVALEGDARTNTMTAASRTRLTLRTTLPPERAGA